MSDQDQHDAELRPEQPAAPPADGDADDDLPRPEQPAAPLTDNADTPFADPQAPDGPHTTRAADADREEDDGDTTDDDAASGARPNWLVIVGAALGLLAIGVGLGTLIPTGPPPLPTAAPLNTTAAALPTALPLPEAIGSPTDTELIAEVGDGGVPRGDFVRLYQPGGNPLDLLDQLIQIELVVQAAAAEGVAVDEAAVTAQIDEIKLAQAGGDETQFLAFLAQNNIASEEELRRLLRRDQLVQEMILRHTTLEQARARHILLAAEADAAEARKAEAEALLKQLEDGGDFAALAGEKSEDPGSKEQGGDLGWAPRGLFVPEFDEAIFTMKVGELRLVQSQFGWHIIELLDAPAVRPLESRDLLETPPGQEAFSTSFLPWVEQLRTDADTAGRVKILVEGQDLVTTPGQ